MAFEKMLVKLEHGLGKECVAEFEQSALEGISARELITMIVDTPQKTKPAQRTARAVSGALRELRSLDVEVIRGTRKNGEPGDPIELDEPVINYEENNPRANTLTVRVSEPFVGGRFDRNIEL